MHRILIAIVFCAPLSAGAQTDAERARQLFEEVKQLCADAPEHCFIIEGEPAECPNPIAAHRAGLQAARDTIDKVLAE